MEVWYILLFSPNKGHRSLNQFPQAISMKFLKFGFDLQQQKKQKNKNIANFFFF